jgi:predicted P-loop ATPase
VRLWYGARSLNVALQADRAEIALFVNALFRFADSGCFASLRAFHQKDGKAPAEFIRPIRINGSLEPLINAAEKAATDAANRDHAVVFAPPVCTFSNNERGRAEDLANGLTLSVEIDEGDIMTARLRLEGLLGPATVIVASGGEWTDPDTGEIYAKLHLHWRLAEPTRDDEDHQRLRLARDMAGKLAGADPTGKPMVHPLRWPGSWNQKADNKPVLARIVQINESAEITLPEALDALFDAIGAARLAEPDLPKSSRPEADPVIVALAAATIPNNDEHYDTWIRYGYACFRGAGSEEGFGIWDAWSRKSGKYNAEEQGAAWRRIHRAILGSRAPRTVGAGTIFWEAAKHGWSRPDPEPPESETDPGYWNSIEGGAGTRQEPTEEAAADGNNVVKLKPKRNKRAQWGWKQEWHVSENGNPLPTLFNAMVALRNSEGLTDIVRYDEMARSVILSTQIPNTPQDKTIPRHIKDGDIIAIQEELQLIGLRRVAKATVQDAIQLRAEQDKFHPVRDYLNSLTWDGTRRIFGWLGRYLGVEGSPYSDKIGELFLIALVARQFKPGCKADYMLILEGPQGALKSSACRVLAGEWFSDNLPDLSRGDAVRLSMHLRGKWLIEIAEMSSFNAAESHKLKEFLTQTEEVYTPKYGHNEVQEPRQCLFIGTTNEAAYLRDATGGRRFWPAKTGEILLPDLAADRDQLFAEAVSLYREGAPWWPDREFEAEHIAPQQDERFERHPWQEPIETWISENGIQRCTVTSVLTGPLSVPLAQISRRMQSDVAAIFVGLKWFRSRSRGRDWFVRPKTEDAG